MGSVVSSPRALVVDDESDIRELLGITLERMHIGVASAGGCAAAIGKLRDEKFDLCLTDMKLPDGDGCTGTDDPQGCHR